MYETFSLTVSFFQKVSFGVSNMKVFISYDRDNKLLCDKVKDDLESVSSIVALRDTSDHEYGENLKERIRTEQIKSSDVVIVLITKESVNSDWVKTEIAWADEQGKRIVPIVEEGVEWTSIPSLDSEAEYVQYDPSDYSSMLKELKNFAKDLASTANTSLNKGSQSGKKGSSLGLIDSDTIDRVKMVKTEDFTPILRKQLVDNAEDVIRNFFSDPSFGTFVNIGTLSTDSDTVIMREDTLINLLQASHRGSGKAFRYAGYKTGILFGVGLIDWLLDKTKKVMKRPALPRHSRDLINTAIDIDERSSWGEIQLGELKRNGAHQTWKAPISISKSFLGKSSTNKSEDKIKFQEVYPIFWQTYLESTFTAALATWGGVRESESKDHDVQRLQAKIEKKEEGSEDLNFKLKVFSPPLYGKTYHNIQQELLLPYLNEEYKTVHGRARTTIEGFMRELSGAEETERENLPNGFQWLVRNVSDEAKEAVATLQRARNSLHKGTHVPGDVSKNQASRDLKLAAGAIFMAMRDLSEEEIDEKELQNQITPSN